MKEFIFTWSIENISYSWHKNRRQINSPSFVADTLRNTLWNLRLYPRGNVRDGYDFLSLYLIREDGGPANFLFNCEFSCVSANNLILKSVRPERLDSISGMGSLLFLRRHEVFVRSKAIYLPKDTLTLRCRMWIRDGDIDQFGQCFGRTRLEIERILSVQDINFSIIKRKKICIHSKRQKDLLTINIAHEEDGLDFCICKVNEELIKFFTVKFSALFKNRKLIDYTNSWFDVPHGVRIKMPFSNIEKEPLPKNQLKLSFELIYSTGKETNSVEKMSPCSFKFPEFTSKCIFSFIPSGKLSDCPNICKELWDLYLKGILCDVELKTPTTSFWVHKTVLCARSPVFLTMFTAEMKEKTSDCIYIEDLEIETSEKFLAFLYTDKFEESEWNSVIKLYYAGDKYQVERLKFVCCCFLINNIDDHNVFELLMLADRHSDTFLKSKAVDYIMMHREKILISPTWKEFYEKQPKLVWRTLLCKYGENDLDKKNMFSSYPNALEDFRSLYQSQALSDIVIETASATFPAHKTILCAGSSKLRKLFACGKSPASLTMENLEDDTVSRLLLFMYTDSLGKIKWKTVTKLYHAAFDYQIERLKIKCSCFFLENLEESNAINLMRLACERHDLRLKALVKDFIYQ